MKDKLVKVKRRRVNWFQVLNDLGNEAMLSYFRSLCNTVHHGKQSHFNKCAYNTLRHFYSTTTINELCEEVGL